MSNNLALERSDPEPGSTALYQKERFITEAGRSQGHLQKGLTGVFTSTLFSYSITTSAMKTPENTDEDPDDP